MEQVVLILENIRSTYNVGSILRTCDAVGVKRVICCGTTPYPRLPNDIRDPVVINKNTRQIAKTALGGEQSINVEYICDATAAIKVCQQINCIIYGLEKQQNATNLLKCVPQMPAAIILGSETQGLEEATIKACDEILEIPQYGIKESLNVSVAAGIALYHFLDYA